MKKKLYYIIDNGGRKVTCHLDSAIDIIKAESPSNTNPDTYDIQWTITPVWLTDEEFENIPESE
jgi:hypothetical protein